MDALGPITEVSPGDSPQLEDREFAYFRRLIKELTGISLVEGKRELLRGRLNKRLRALGLKGYKSYRQYLSDAGNRNAEAPLLINCVTTNKTSFFRERHHFEFLRQRILPDFVANARRGGDNRLRVWSAACSLGHEPYSIAMTIRDFFAGAPLPDTRILASDIDTDCLREAANGTYDESLVADFAVEAKRAHLLRGAGQHTGKVLVRPELRDLITFRQINFVDDAWPINTRFDVIFCRNALIYFEPDLQAALVRRFLTYLKPSGYLILGHSENASSLPEVTSLGNTIYRPAVATDQPPRRNPARRVPSETTSNEDRLKSEGRPREAQSTPRRPIVAGEYFASLDTVEITTLLGSCIAACLYDPRVRAGGMNHFLLPEGDTNASDAACYGINAMELLINEIMQIGGARDRLVARLYGGARVMGDHLRQSTVGERNIDFVRKYLTTEGIPIVEQKVGGQQAMRVSMTANSGVVVATHLDTQCSRAQASVDARTARAAVDGAAEQDDQITLF